MRIDAIAIGSKVEHDQYGVGEVIPRTAHTHRNYTHVYFPDELRRPAQGNKPEQRGTRRRVRTENLRVLRGPKK